MIIDCNRDHDHAMMYEILDMTTGQWITKDPIFYADDEAGIICLYKKDEQDNFYVDPEDHTRVAQEEKNVRIKICLKAGIEDPAKELARRKEELDKFRRGEEANLNW